jgi:hypothetical protein
MKIMLLRKAEIVVFVLTSFIVFLLTSGCATTMLVQEVQEIQPYSQEQEVMDGIFKLKIEEAYWRDDLNMSEALGEDYPTLQQPNVQMPKFKPDAKFLVVVISVTNTDKKPYGMGHGLMFLLKNKNDVEYSTSQKVAGGGGQLAAGGTNIAPTYNPNMPKKYKIIFDVPKDDYTLVASKAVFRYGASYRDKDLFKWRLNRVRE